MTRILSIRLSVAVVEVALVVAFNADEPKFAPVEEAFKYTVLNETLTLDVAVVEVILMPFSALAALTAVVRRLPTRFLKALIVTPLERSIPFVAPAALLFSRL